MKTFSDYLTEAEYLAENPAIGDGFVIEIAREEIMLESYVVDIVEDGIVIEADDTIMRILTHVGYLTEDSHTPTAGIYKEVNFQHSSNTDLEEQDGIKNEADEVIDYPHVGTGTSSNMQMAVDIARNQARANMMRSAHGDTFQDKEVPPYDEGKVQLIPGQKPGTYQATIRMRQRPMPTSTSTPTNEAKYQGREVPLGKKMAGDVKKSKVYVRGPKGNVVKVNFGDPNMKIKKSNPKRRKSFRARHNCDNPGPRWKARYWSCRSW